MKNIFVVTLLAFTFLFSCSKKQKTLVEEKVKTPMEQTFAADKNALLWKVSGKGLTQESYVFGTIHMIGKEDYFLTDAMRAAFDKSNRVVFEINMEEMTDFSVIFELMSKITMDGGKTLKDLLSEEDYKFVKGHFEKMGLPLFFLEKIKPLFLSTFASGDMAPGDMQSGKIMSYEMEFMEMAQKGKKEMDGLETIEYQLSMFDSIPYEAQAEMLVESIKGADSGADQFQEMVEIYKKQDLKGLYEMIQGDEEGIGEYEDLLLVQRNKNWIPLMENMMKDKTTFFAVGAGHLGGENGVIGLLRKEGYTLTAVEPVE